MTQALTQAAQEPVGQAHAPLAAGLQQGIGRRMQDAETQAGAGRLGRGTVRLQPADGGKKLEVRGYVGMPMLGRTQTWIRVE